MLEERLSRVNAMPVDVSIVIVNYETPVELVSCLRSVAAASNGLAVETFVIDNASRSFDADSVAKALPDVTVIRNRRNVGFARAANAGLRRASGRYLLLLNPDATLAPDGLALMVRYMDEHADVGVATARLACPTAASILPADAPSRHLSRAFYRMTYLSRLFPRSRRFAQYNLTYLDEHAEVEIDAPCGAFMIVRSGIRRPGRAARRDVLHVRRGPRLVVPRQARRLEGDVHAGDDGHAHQASEQPKVTTGHDPRVP